MQTMIYREFVSHIKGVDVKYKNCDYTTILCASHIPELIHLEVVDDGIFIGSSVTFSNLETFLQEQINNLSGELST